MSEILAPAGTLEALNAAVRSGADAIYFGASDFNARRNADNFSDDDIQSVVSYCHIRGVRAYLTLNTLVCDDELSTAMLLLDKAADAGIDGIIIQDVGLAALAHSAYPTLPLHASTQMTVHNISGVQYLHERGYTRVVLARELSANQLEKICAYADSVGMQTEIFVHGALCMSMSGQCLLSALLGSRSGNRGLCAGPCRLPFSVQNGNGHDLSLKDLDLYTHFDKLRSLNITSYKIEGRMKRPEYVAMAVDAAICARDNGNMLSQKLTDLQAIFSRSGFTDSYFSGKADSDIFGIRSEQDIAASRRIMNSAHELYRRERQSVEITMTLSVNKDKPCLLTLCDGKHTVTACGEPPQIAQNKPLDAEYAKIRLTRTGGTPYLVTEFTADIDDGLTVSGAAISALKSDAFGKLNSMRGKPTAYKKHIYSSEYAGTAHKRQLFVSLHSLSQLPDSFTADMLILPLSSDLDRVTALIKGGQRIAIKTPAYFFDNEDYIAKRLFLFKQAGVEFAVAENIGALPLIHNSKLKILGGAGLNCFNSAAAYSLGCDMQTLSYELTRAQLSALRSPVPRGIIAYGRIPLMLLACCPRKAHNSCSDCDGAITDRMGVTDKLLCEDGATRLYSDRPLYVADCPAIINSVDFITLLFTDESASEVRRIIDCFRRSLPYNGSFTRGLYLRGVK